MTANKLSDETVAAAIGCSRETVSRYRRKLMLPGWENVARIRTFSGGAVGADDWLAEAQPEAAE